MCRQNRPWFRGARLGVDLASSNAVVALPRFAFPDDESVTVRFSSPEIDVRSLSSDDDTRRAVLATPRAFVLELPESIKEQLAASQAPFEPPRATAPSAPPPAWTTGAFPAPTREGRNLLVVLAAVLFGGVLAVTGVAGISPESNGGSNPVGFAVHGPKALERTVRTRDRIAGYSPRVDAVTVSVDSLRRSRRR